MITMIKMTIKMIKMIKMMRTGWEHPPAAALCLPAPLATSRSRPETLSSSWNLINHANCTWKVSHCKKVQQGCESIKRVQLTRVEFYERGPEQSGVLSVGAEGEAKVWQGDIILCSQLWRGYWKLKFNFLSNRPKVYTSWINKPANIWSILKISGFPSQKCDQKRHSPVKGRVVLTPLIIRYRTLEGRQYLLIFLLSLTNTFITRSKSKQQSDDETSRLVHLKADSVRP